MANNTYLISKHALNRIIERLVLSQNIKLNKKQISKNIKRARKIIIDDIENCFAKSYSSDGRYKYVYAGLNQQNKSKKYVITLYDNVVVTVINDLDLNEELKKHTLIFEKNEKNIIKTERCCITDYIYTLINNNKFLFVIDSFSDGICSTKFIEGC